MSDKKAKPISMPKDDRELKDSDAKGKQKKKPTVKK